MDWRQQARAEIEGLKPYFVTKAAGWVRQLAPDSHPTCCSSRPDSGGAWDEEAVVKMWSSDRARDAVSRYFDALKGGPV